MLTMTPLSAPRAAARHQSSYSYVVSIPHAVLYHAIRLIAELISGWINRYRYSRFLLITWLLIFITPVSINTPSTPQYQRTTQYNQQAVSILFDPTSRLSSVPSTSRVWDRGKDQRVAAPVHCVEPLTQA